jgi:ketosteroid isomerase-like protein
MSHTSDHAEIRNVIGRYFQYGDDNDWQTWATLLTDDFVLDVNGHVVSGRDANLQGHIDLHSPQIPHGRHLGANFVVDIDGDTAVASFDWVWVASIGVPSAMHLSILEMGRSVDSFRKVENRWLMASRDNRPLFFHPETARPENPRLDIDR